MGKPKARLETTISFQETRSQVLNKLDNISYGKGEDALLGALDAVAEHFGRKREELGAFLLKAAGCSWGPKEAEALLVAARAVVATHRHELETRGTRLYSPAEQDRNAATGELAAVLKTIDGETSDGRP